ncbi:hypothetical protein L861_19780 [Litchfieldella anticariensis FP35 = DSM 16096]|uniref:Uncharacterized protein n=1 Tax=Litchfieldella anticariensis (strain DSM 16096 / CECT 5854 / CIP 108499 / LMG 22089 / FP35) TaxID=1121939 RepID=S2L2J8_LITA3|nr:hypothetical protein L861_19780 [Halomonas anticariensis FP35 = DSM 16096]
MNVGTFALGLQLLGLILLVYGWFTLNPAGFVGVVLIILGAVLRWTRRTGDNGK